MTIRSTRQTAAALFYEVRDQRTLQYGATVDALTRPVALVVHPAAAHTADGQAAARALTGMLVRTHSQVRIITPPVPAVGQNGQTLYQHLSSIAAQIDPFQDTRRGAQPGELIVLVAGSSANLRDPAVTRRCGRRQ
jgi:hypothetical protein